MGVWKERLYHHGVARRFEIATPRRFRAARSKHP